MRTGTLSVPKQFTRTSNKSNPERSKSASLRTKKKPSFSSIQLLLFILISVMMPTLSFALGYASFGRIPLPADDPNPKEVPKTDLNKPFTLPGTDKPTIELFANYPYCHREVSGKNRTPLVPIEPSCMFSISGIFCGDPNGIGEEHIPNGDVYKGEFSNGRKHGWGISKAKRTKIVGVFKNGVLTHYLKDYPEQTLYQYRYESPENPKRVSRKKTKRHLEYMPKFIIEDMQKSKKVNDKRKQDRDLLTSLFEGSKVYAL
ncbi:hypothetical protein DID77_02860 [Candidatus Marinamargulisbacteria bacterium SCGC AG-439-L15]|nr:hypothetical protein DID77_02860 [Candidatus Marinamargulisbacteria bacterium SCGC AG-439-L15]